MHVCGQQRRMSGETRKAGLFGSFRMSGKKDKLAEQDFVLSSPTNMRRESSDVIGGTGGVVARVFPGLTRVFKRLGRTRQPFQPGAKSEYGAEEGRRCASFFFLWRRCCF